MYNSRLRRGGRAWLNALVLKTSRSEMASWVRIPPPPPLLFIRRNVMHLTQFITNIKTPIFTRVKTSLSALLGATALLSLGLSTPVIARDIVITSGTTTNNSGGSLNGNDTANVIATLDTGITDSEHGILTSDENNKITVSNEGRIITGGNNAHGIYHTGDTNPVMNGFNTTTVSGRITTTGLSAYGIYNKGDTNTTSVSGSIATGNESSNSGRDGYGIFNEGNDNTTNLSGDITTINSSGYGIYNKGNKNTTIMSGSIKTTGSLSYGIYNFGDENITTMSGSITTTGNYAMGIVNFADDNTTTLSGSIATTGEEAFGIYNGGDTNKTTISGTVKATGTKSAALYNESGSGNSFTLNEGATIIGDILSRDGTTNSKLIFNLGASTSYAYSVSGKGAGTGAGQWTFSDLDGRSQVVTTLTGANASVCDTTITGAGNDTCNLVTAVGAANAEVQNELQYITSTSLINSLRLDTPVNTSQQGTPETDVWFDVYGVSTERDASTWDTTGVVFNADTYGLTIGKPFFLGESFGLDLVFNYSQTDLDLGITKHQNIAAESFNFGVVMTDLASSSNWDVDAFGFIGHNSYEGKRKVMNNQVSTGSETVTSSYSGIKALVGFNADYTSSINEAVSFKGGINANLSNEAIGAYSESKYSTWNARTLSQAATGISAGFTHKRDLLTTFVTFGAEYSSLLKGETASYSNNSTATSYTDHDASDDMVSEVAVGFKYAGANGVSFEGSIKDSSSDKGLSSTSANFGLNWEF